jgi:hypothetical protein
MKNILLLFFCLVASIYAAQKKEVIEIKHVGIEEKPVYALFIYNYQPGKSNKLFEKNCFVDNKTFEAVKLFIIDNDRAIHKSDSTISEYGTFQIKFIALKGTDAIIEKKFYLYPRDYTNIFFKNLAAFIRNRKLDSNLADTITETL